MRVNRFLLPILALAFFLGTVLVAQAAGVWVTNGRAGTDLTRLTPADLKGWMTLQDVMNGLHISQADLYAAGNVPTTIPPTTALNKLEAQVPEFSVTALRDTLTAKLGTGSASSASPTQASASASDSTANTPAAPTAPSASHATPTPLPVGQVLPANQIRGSMSLQSVSEQCRVPLDSLITALKLPADTDTKLALKELVAQGKLSEVSQVQQVVTEMQGK
jgi:hypothetical protein